MKRFFSVSSSSAREFANVTSRRVKQPRQVNVGDPNTLLPRTVAEVPPYPYGEATSYKQSNYGLYGSKTLHFGHQISEYGNKHVRVFYPNVQKVTLWSETLRRKIPVRVVASVLKTITREGGLDNYLLKDKTARIKELGPYGWNLRYEVLKRLQEVERSQAAPLGHIEGTPIYFEVIRDGQKFGVTAGRTRLIKELHAAKNRPTTLKAFMLEHRGTSPETLLDELQANGVVIDRFLAPQI